MAVFNIPDRVISGVAAEIHARTNRDYQIPVVGVESNLETPQIFEIMPFNEIDFLNARFYAIDGSRNSHSFYNGVSLCFYQAGYVCFQGGCQQRLNSSDDPVVLGNVFHGNKMLVLSEEDLNQFYEEFLELAAVKSLIAFFNAKPEKIFQYSEKALLKTVPTLLGFCQEVLEWACVLHIIENAPLKAGDFILRDGTLRSLYIGQEYLRELGNRLHSLNARIVGVTKQSPIKTELAYTYSKIDNYLQSKLKPGYPFKQEDPSRQKLCCYFEVPDVVLLAAYSGDMYAKKDIVGGRGFGLFFTARLDYVEKLQNYDWLVCDLNIYDCAPGIASKQTQRDVGAISRIMHDLTSTTQEHYILGYPYPLVEAHNLVSLTGDFKKEAIARVKNALYSSQQMDHTAIENLFLDIHSRF